jgi:O-antigen/teichoic acid export membrane protein
MKFKEVSQRRKQTPGVQTKKKTKTSLVTVIILIYAAAIVLMGFGAAFLDLLGNGVIWVIILIVGLIAAVSGFRRIGEVPGKKGLTGIVLTTAGILIGAAMIVVNPVSDLWYYGAVILLIFAVTIMEKELIEQYNLTTTRKLPQFNKQGGDDRA